MTSNLIDIFSRRANQVKFMVRERTTILFLLIFLHTRFYFSEIKINRHHLDVLEET